MLAAIVAALAAAQGPAAQERRPEELEVMRTKTGYPLANDQLAIDAVFSHVEFDEGGTDDRRVFDGTETRIEGQIAYGITDAITAEIRFPYAFVDPDGGDSASGWSDVELDLKIGVPDQGTARPAHIAIGGRLTVPTGDEERGLGQEDPELRAYLAMSGELASVGLHAQPYVELQDDRRGQLGLNAAAEIEAFGPGLRALVGFNGLWETGQGTIASVIPGLAYSPGAGFEVAVGVPIGLTDDAADWGVLADFEAAF